MIFLFFLFVENEVEYVEKDKSSGGVFQHDDDLSSATTSMKEIKALEVDIQP